jgi:Uma2 family endonuclease
MTAATNLQAWPIVLHLGPLHDRLSDREFLDLCRRNRDLRIELTSDGDLVIMTPTGGEGGRRGLELSRLFADWAVKDGTGVGFDSSTGFSLPNRAKRSPDAAWVERSRWEKLAPAEREGFPPLCPDFVVELGSRTDALVDLQAKMREYIEHGSRLGWLIDPLERQVHIYRPGAEVEVLSEPRAVSGEPVLPGFVLDLTRIW